MARILVVEDEDEIRCMLAEALAHAGHDVIEAESGDAASVLLETLGTLDALVTDVNMPGRLNGVSLGRQFRARHADSPILYVTGSPDAFVNVPLCKERNIVLARPCGLLRLAGVVRAMLALENTRARLGSETIMSSAALHSRDSFPVILNARSE